MQNIFFTVILFTLLSGLTGCSFTPFMYKPDLAQGNLFSEEQIADIQPGMSREHVHLILGTPAIADPFHPEKESYVFFYKSGASDRRYQRSLNIDYANGVVIGKHITPLHIQ